ncbi:PAP2 superfamily protein [Tritonibacter multivorans]|uniref:PAP2 superfamily protein n=1 Tax=Tritonibacter multivorans TaxID=928856 RepID=A0A0P1GH28_9RHOB|nr:phosphatase PAP2 family protein [Tritonibacter multivorans]MDA7419514.1 phosphatase PAP2 family protein [Tritonibacter multivorans]CUH75615.1 PAP2 superfamily protein [Tritonibacter multivorans]SFC64244.1 PAP2 superfamily protein [Tritonibacter multivorans]
MFDFPPAAEVHPRIEPEKDKCFSARLRWLVLRAMRHFGLMVVLGVIMVCVMLGGARDVEKLGDNLQIALPLTGLACATAEGRGVQYFGRFLLLEVGIHSSKNLLGDQPINLRPSGGNRGFPSGHTSAAAFGATALVQGCLRSNKSAQAAVVIAAGFVGTTRIEHNAHSALQVLAGAVLGFVVQAASLVAFDRAFGRFWRGCAIGLGWLGARAVMAVRHVRSWRDKGMRV